MAKRNGQWTVLARRLLAVLLPVLLRELKKRSKNKTTASTQTPPERRVETATKPRKAKKRKTLPIEPDPAPRKASKREPINDAPSTRKPRHESPIAQLFKAKRSDQIITDSGVVVKVLSDDNVGSRHQRLLVEVDHTNVTIKIAHNIDLAPRVPAREGDHLTFKGEYEWNDLGGALHWTHHDPKQWRDGGWIELDGKRYE